MNASLNISIQTDWIIAILFFSPKSESISEHNHSSWLDFCDFSSRKRHQKIIEPHINTSRSHFATAFVTLILKECSTWVMDPLSKVTIYDMSHECHGIGILGRQFHWSTFRRVSLSSQNKIFYFQGVFTLHASMAKHILCSNKSSNPMISFIIDYWNE